MDRVLCFDTITKNKLSYQPDPPKTHSTLKFFSPEKALELHKQQKKMEKSNSSKLVNEYEESDASSASEVLCLRVDEEE